MVLAIKRLLGIEIKWEEDESEEVVGATWEKNGKRRL